VADDAEADDTETETDNAYEVEAVVVAVVNDHADSMAPPPSSTTGSLPGALTRLVLVSFCRVLRCHHRISLL